MEKHTKEYAEKLANEYAENKSSADVFKQSHSTDFLNGYLKAVEETNVKWISVEDRLPEENLDVFCYTNVGGKCVCFYKNGNWRYQHNSGLIDTILNITHWMPLPNKPI